MSTIARHDESDDARRQGSPGTAMVDRATTRASLVQRDLASPEVARGDDVARGTSDLASAAAVGTWPYPGGKNGAGVYHRLINLMPPHDFYIEAFLGSGAIMRRKRLASAGNVGIDVDAGVIARHVAGGHAGYELIQGDAVSWLREWAWEPGVKALVYADPPYLGSARFWPGRDCYAHEFKGEAEHRELLRILTTIPAMVMVSGYPSALYDEELSGWRRVEYSAQTRGGVKREVAWMNYAEPTELHDYRFLGEGYHDRCRIGRKIARWTRRLKAMPALERSAVIAAVVEAAGR